MLTSLKIERYLHALKGHSREASIYLLSFKIERYLHAYPDSLTRKRFFIGNFPVHILKF
jgi:hypothetical protein